MSLLLFTEREHFIKIQNERLMIFIFFRDATLMQSQQMAWQKSYITAKCGYVLNNLYLCSHNSLKQLWQIIHYLSD